MTSRAGTAAEAAAAASRGGPEASLEERSIRLAVFSPVPPDTSGIAAYLADLMPLLPAAWEVDVFTDQGASGAARELSAGRPSPVGCFEHTDFVGRHAANPYDLNVYQVGNSTARTYVHRYVTEYPGLLVLHDGVLHPARVDACTRAADIAEYRRAAVACRGAVGAAVGHLVAGGLGGPGLYFTFPMCEDLVRGSLYTVMHGELASGWLRAFVPEARIGSVVHWRSVDCADERRTAWRGRLGEPGDVIIGSFGHAGPERRLDRVLSALADIDPGRPWRLAVVGSVDERLDLRGLAQKLGIGDRVGWYPDLGDPDFRAVMGSVDLAVNLRYPSARSSSGVLHQLLQLGVPTMISDLVHWRDYPDDAIARIPTGPGDAETKALRAALARWIVNPEARAAAGRAATRWAERHATPRFMGQSYVSAVEKALAAGAD